MKLDQLRIALCIIALMAPLEERAYAGVSAEEADRLGAELTPYGAEQAGNAEGTIPAWEGGLTTADMDAGHQNGTFHADPFAEDQPLFTITAENMDQYADQLSDGQQQLFKRFPDFRMVIYPTRRTHAAPQWIYDETRKNATRATLSADRLGVENAYGGVPFPIPSKGEEVVFNHLTRFQGSTRSGPYLVGRVLENQKFVVGAGGTVYEKYPYHQEGGSPENYNGNILSLLFMYDQPVRRNGELLLVLDPLNQSEKSRMAWQYLPGQRRVRRAPTVAYDTPSTSTGSMTLFDQVYIFNGALDRYNWELIGKKEMFIPYNNYQTELCTRDELLTAHFPNPDKIRMELHRVWVVEATLKKGKRHTFAKRIMFVDEDSWNMVWSDIYDGKGELWRTSYGTSKNEWELPATILRSQFFIDFTRYDYATYFLLNDAGEYTRVNDEVSDDIFTPRHLRNLGRR